jgi:serine/threonine-protein kinase HipA
MSLLTLWAGGARAGDLDAGDGLWALAYEATWNAFALSPRFPLTARHFQDSARDRQVEWFFDNLLPEGHLRERIAQRDRIDPRDTWALLARHGQDMAGALSLMPQGIEPAAEEILVPLPPAVLQERIRESRARNLPLMAAWEEIRMSLAGAQEKLGVRIDASGAMYLPEGSAPSTHIIKPENVSGDFPFCPANEFFCMRLARALQVPVPEVDLLHLEEPVYVIERFDRERVMGGGMPAVRRIHQIDLCQALGVAPSKKYESEGGLGLHQLLAVARSPFLDRPIVATGEVIRWVVFNYLIGNLDAHAKNMAFLLRGSKAAVAPFYDMLCVEAYLPGQTMAMSIAGENKPGWVEGPHWDALAHEADVAPRAVRTILARMIARVPEAVSSVMADARLTPAERKFLGDKVLPVIEARKGFIAAALKSRPLTLRQLLVCQELDPGVRERLAARGQA